MSYPRLYPLGGSSGPLRLQGWDRATLAGRVLPGKVRVQGAAVRLKEDPKERAGRHGGKPTTHGLEAQRLQVRVTCWTNEQMDEVDQIAQSIVPQPGRNPLGAVGFEAPAIRGLGIDAVLVLGASQWEESSEIRGGKEKTFYLKHWLGGPKTKATATKTAERTVRNKVREDAEKQKNPPPTASSANFSPVDANFSPG